MYRWLNFYRTLIYLRELSFLFSNSEDYQLLVQKLAEEEAKMQEKEKTIALMTMLKEGSVSETLPVPGKVIRDGKKLLKLEGYGGKVRGR